MQVFEKIGNVVLSENLSAIKFRVKINRQSFKLLYGDLYSDKISAVVRELSTNAYDSHVAAGKPEIPFEIHLPNDLEPFFYIRDFGTGLSHDQICGEDGIYITFCMSDKITSDDYTGCLGLGSKSPLNYTDNFTVESNFNGTKYSYVVFLDEIGEPCIAPLGSSETNEVNGLKVGFAVKQEDFDEFIGKTANVLSWFKTRPNVVGAADFKFVEREYLRKTDRYGIHKERQDVSRVIMGNVAYPVDASDLAYNKVTDVERAVLEYGVDFFLDIGDVEFVPSREKLSYTQRTVDGVKKYLKDAIESIKEQLESQVQQQPTVWQARRMLHDIKHSILGKVRALATVMYNGKEIAEYIKFDSTVEKLMPGMDKANFLYPKCETLQLRKEHYRRNPEDTIYCDGSVVYFNDMDRGGYMRINRHVRDNYSKRAYMLTGVNAVFLEETGLGEVVIKASSLPQPERQKRESNGVRGTYTKRTVLQEYIPENRGTYASSWWNDVEVDVRAGGVYVVVSYGQIVEGERKRLPSEIRKKYLAVKALRPDFKLLGIRPAHMGRMEKYKHRWINFDTYAESVLKAELPKHLENINLAKQSSEVDNYDRYERFIPYVFEEYSLFGQFIRKLEKAKVATTDVEAMAVMKLNDHVSNPVEFSTDNDLVKLENGLDVAYPLIDHLEWYGIGGFMDEFVEYIRAMDDRRFNNQLKEAI